jgi:hypothetical protein
MKYLVLLLVSSQALASGGDLGGGGTLPAAFKLSPQERARLASHQNPNLAFEAWRHSLEDQRRQDELMLKVFETLILPQIQE